MPESVSSKAPGVFPRTSRCYAISRAGTTGTWSQDTNHLPAGPWPNTASAGWESNNVGVFDAFDAYQKSVDADPVQVATARERRDVFVQALQKADDVKELVRSGSLERRTQLKPIHDVDLIVVFDAAAVPGWGSPGGFHKRGPDHGAVVKTEGVYLLCPKRIDAIRGGSCSNFTDAGIWVIARRGRAKVWTARRANNTPESKTPLGATLDEPNSYDRIRLRDTGEFRGDFVT